MNSIESQLRRLIIDEYDSISGFSRKSKIPTSSITTLLSRGINTATITTLSKLCENLSISLDELQKGRIVKRDGPCKIVDYKDSCDIETIINQLTEYLRSKKTLTLNERELTKEDIDKLIYAIEVSVNMLK